MTTENAYWSKMVCPIVQHKPVQVRKSVEGSLVQEIKKVRRVYRGKGRKPDKGTAILSVDTDEQAVRVFMADYHVDPTLIESTVQKWAELLPTMPERGAGRLYKWSHHDERGITPVQWTFELRSVLALIGALVQCMPEPVQAIRNHLVHGDDGQKRSEQMVGFDYDDTVEAYTRFIVAFVVPYAVRKISQLEREMTGQVYERSLHRTTDMGQGGRRFSDADISDILSRTILAAFFPLYCRTLPLTDKGKAYVMVKSCTLISRKVGEKEYRRRICAPSLQKLDAMVRLFRKGKITEQEYNEFLSKFTLPKSGKRASVRMYKENGFWLLYKCEQTGQRFSVFTKSAQRAEQLSKMTSFSGEVDKVIPVNKTEVTELDADSVYSWSADRAFFRSLKGMTRNLYRFLMRRCNHDDLLITEHNESRRLRRNAEHLFSLQEVKDTVQDLTNVQKDVIEAELSLDVVPANVHRLSRKVWLYNRIVETRTGVNPKMTVRAYKELRDVTFHCIAVQLGLVEEPTPTPVHHYTEEELDSLVYKVPAWIRERADRVQLTSFETAFAIQSGIDKRTPQWPAPVSVSRLPYFVYDDTYGMVYVRPNEPLAVHLNTMSGGNSYDEPVQLKPVQYPVHSRSMARHIAAVRAITGRSEQHQPVDLDSMTVNGFTVPVWSVHQEAWVAKCPEVNITSAVNEVLPDGMYGPYRPMGSVVVVDKNSPVQLYYTKQPIQVYYTDVCTADGDGI